MKSFHVIALCLELAAFGTRAQTTNTASAPPSTTPQVVAAGADYNLWQWQTCEQLTNGQIVTKTHSYTELASGLNYQFPTTAQWVPSQELIEPYAQGAIAQYGQHQIIFANNLNSTGAIDEMTPDGKRLRSNILGLFYSDPTTGESVQIAGVQDSEGQLVAANQVLYVNAFNGLKASVLFTYRRDGMEQDVILDAQPPAPETVGLSSETAELVVITEFLNPPEFSVWDVGTDTEGLEPDQAVSWGATSLGRGKAFSLGDKDIPVVVTKQYINDNGRYFLLEKVRYRDIKSALSSLPDQASNAHGLPDMASKHLKLPKAPTAKSAARPMHLALGKLPSKGYVLDYVSLNTAYTNFDFQGDTTYYVSGNINIAGTNIYEGNTVIKFATNAAITGVSGSVMKFLSDQYRPVVFTAKDDNAIGTTISGSSGTPSGYYANPALNLASMGSLTLSNFRIAYANQGLSLPSAATAFYDAQLLKCATAVSGIKGPVTLENVLFSNVKTNFNATSSTNTIFVQNATFNNTFGLIDGSSMNTKLYLTNCVFVNATNLNGNISAGYNGFYRSPPVGTASVTNTFYPLVQAGSADCYLTNGTAFTNAGTAYADPNDLEQLWTRTTHPPIIYSNATISAAATLSIQARRDTNSSPDLGYNYDPLDYIFANSTALSNLTFTAGTAVAWAFNSAGSTYGLAMGDSATASFNGTVTSPCYFVRDSMVQESVDGNWTAQSSLAGITGQSYVHAPPGMTAGFTIFSTPSGETGPYADNHSTLFVFAGSDCEFYSGAGDAYYASHNITNCLFVNCAPESLENSGTANLTMQGCTFFRGNLDAQKPGGTGAWPLAIFNCAFDSTTFSMSANGGTTNGYYTDYNSFLLNSNRTLYDGSHDLTVTNGYGWQAGWLGNYYLPPNSPLIQMGSTNANLLGLYHYTTQTNQTPETNAIVDLGYHYVALDTNGLPVDSNGDAIPDYLEYPYGMPPSIISQPAGELAIVGYDASFSVEAAGFPPPSCQWFFNVTNFLAGATNTILTLTNVQLMNAGNYSVVVSNLLGVATSSLASLAVETSPITVSAGTNQTLVLPANVNSSNLSEAPFSILPTSLMNLASGIEYLAASNALLVPTYDGASTTTFYLLAPDNSVSQLTVVSNCALYALDPNDGGYVATAKNSAGGFNVGDIFFGNNFVTNLEVMRLNSAGGNLWTNGEYTNAWVSLTNAEFVVSLQVDDTGVWGGDLIVCTLDDQLDDLYLWRIDSGGNATKIATLGIIYFLDPHITLVPNDVQKYGPWAGRILVPAGDDAGAFIDGAPAGGAYTVDTNGVVTLYPVAEINGNSIAPANAYIIPPNENLLRVHNEYGFPSETNIYFVPSAQLQGMVGDILIDSQWQSVYRVHWDGTNFNILAFDETDGEDWGQTTFAPFIPGETAVNFLQLSGAVSDHPLLTTSSNIWSQISGPGRAVFGNPAVTNTTVTFSRLGNYDLRLTAYDGQFTSYTDVMVSVVTNLAPVASAGTNQVASGLSTTLVGTASDDGLPYGRTNVGWAEVSGPGTATWGNSNQLSTTVTFSAPGTYLCQLTVDDGQATNCSQVSVTAGMPSLTLAPVWGSSPVNTYYNLTAILRDQYNHPMVGSNIVFIVSGVNSESWTGRTDTNGTLVSGYESGNVGQDLIVASNIESGAVSYPVIVYWAPTLGCGDTVQSYDKSGWSPDWPTNNFHYSDFYSISAVAGAPLAIVLAAPDEFGIYNVMLLLRDSSNNVVAEATNAIYQPLEFTPPTSGNYMLEVADLGAGIQPWYYLYPSYFLSITCTNGGEDLPSGVGVSVNSTNVPSGGTIVFPNSEGNPTYATLTITNPVAYGNLPVSDLEIYNIQITGDFTNTSGITSLDVPAGGSATLVLGFNGSGNGAAVGQLTMTCNSPDWVYVASLAGFGNIGIITTVAGNYDLGEAYSGDGYSATNAGLSGPAGLVRDAIGNLYIADTGNGVIRKVDTNGIITTVAGNYNLGGSYSGDGYAATNAGLSGPSGIAMDASGNLYIADTGNSLIRKVATNGIITTVAGHTNLWGYSGDGQAATNACLEYPTGVSVDTSGNLYIADDYHEVIRKVDTNGIITTVAGNNSLGGSYSGDGYGATNAGLYLPTTVVVDAAGNLYIDDLGNNVIRKVDTNGIITTVAGNYNLGGSYSGDGFAATNAALNVPTSIFVDAAGNLYIADAGNNIIREVDINGIINTVAGDPYLGGDTWGTYSGDGSAAVNAGLNWPVGITVDASGNIIFADLENNVIRKVAFPYNLTIEGGTN